MYLTKTIKNMLFLPHVCGGGGGGGGGGERENIMYVECVLRSKLQFYSGNWKTLKAGTGSGNGNGNVLSGRMRMISMNGRGNLLMAE